MTQADLFTPDSPDEIQYSEALAALVNQEEEYRIENGIVPPWVEADFLLAKDERRLLELVDDHAGYLILDDDWHVMAYGSDGARRVSGFTLAMGMRADANSKAVLNAAIRRELVTATRDGLSGGVRLDMTRRGRYFLDLCQHDAAWDDMED